MHQGNCISTVHFFSQTRLARLQQPFMQQRGITFPFSLTTLLLPDSGSCSRNLGLAVFFAFRDKRVRVQWVGLYTPRELHFSGTSGITSAVPPRKRHQQIFTHPGKFYFLSSLRVTSRLRQLFTHQGNSICSFRVRV